MDSLSLASSLDFSASAYGVVNSSAKPLITLDRISRRFGSLRALDDVSLHIAAGSVHGLLGENGAGKTTLMRIVFGLLKADSGTINWQDKPFRARSPADALDAGIGMVHQHYTLVPAMSVAENVALGGHGRFRLASAAARVIEVGAGAGLALDPHARVGDLPVGAQQRCEIVKALARDVRLLILDEPTAVLAPREAHELLRWLRSFADKGNAVVLITHKLHEALSVADDITVLRQGRVVLQTSTAKTSERELAAAMLGSAHGSAHGLAHAAAHGSTHDAIQNPLLPPAYSPAHTASAAPDSSAAESQAIKPATITLKDASWHDSNGLMRVRSASLEVHAGEIVGIAAIEGAGQHELLRIMAGRLRADSGSATLPARVGFVPEDRLRDALLPDAPLYENLALSGAGQREGIINWSAFHSDTARLISRFDVRAGGPDDLMHTLSGGNQQRFVLGRELMDDPPALVVENPSRGLDFHATNAIHAELRAARDRGTAVVVYSSDLDEVLLLADRVYAMHDGRVIETPPERDAVGRAILGAFDV